jgi:transposase
LRRGDLTAAEWRELKARLAAARGRRGRPPENTRAVINGILWRQRTGAPWRDVPERYGDWNKIYRRFRRWCQSGVWATVVTVLGDPAADGEGKAGPRPARGDIRTNQRRTSGAGSRFAKGQGGAGFSLARPDARLPAGLSTRRGPARPAAR